MKLIIQKEPDHWTCYASRPGMNVGAGASVEAAVGACIILNPEAFGVLEIRYDMLHERTREEVQRREYEPVIVKSTKLIKLIT